VLAPDVAADAVHGPAPGDEDDVAALEPRLVQRGGEGLGEHRPGLRLLRPAGGDVHAAQAEELAQAAGQRRVDVRRHDLDAHDPELARPAQRAAHGGAADAEVVRDDLLRLALLVVHDGRRHEDVDVVGRGESHGAILAERRGACTCPPAHAEVRTVCNFVLDICAAPAYS